MTTPSNAPLPLTVVVIGDDLSFLTRIALALGAADVRVFAHRTPTLAALYKCVHVDAPDIVLLTQSTASTDAIDVIRRHAPAHAQVILLLDQAGPPPTAIMYHSDGYIWRDVGDDRLVAFVKSAGRRRGSLTRMRAVKAGT